MRSRVRRETGSPHDSPWRAQDRRRREPVSGPASDDAVPSCGGPPAEEAGASIPHADVRTIPGRLQGPARPERDTLSLQSFLLLNGCILLVVGGGLGLPFWLRLARTPEEADAWRVAHSAICVGAVGIIAVSSAYPMIELSSELRAILVGGILLTGYGFGLSTSLSALTGHRGLVWKKGLDAIVFIFMVLGALGSAVAGPVLVFGAYRAWAG